MSSVKGEITVLGEEKKKNKPTTQIAPQLGTTYGAGWAMVTRDGQDDAERSHLGLDPVPSLRLH